ncbi:MAG: hypothetical protein ACOCXJ_03735, partial [Planctomycetota bacterium]
GEAGYKLGLCLRRLDRAAEAREVWREVLQDEADRWALLAGCELWADHLVARRFEAARSVAESISFSAGGRGLLELPHELRERLLQQVRGLASGIDLIRPEPQRIAMLQATHQALAVLGAGPHARVWVAFSLARALHWEERYQQALPILQEMLDLPEAQWSPRTHILLSFEWLWLARLAGTVSTIDPRVLHPLARDLARVQGLAADGALEAALELAADLDRRMQQQGGVEYKHWAMLRLLRALRPEADLRLGALADATPVAYQDGFGANDPRTGLDLIYALAIESATGDLQTDTVARLMASMQGLGDRLGEAGLGAAVLRVVQPDPDTLRRTWSSQRGRMVLHELALCHLDMRSLVVQAQALLLYGRIVDQLTPADAPALCDEAIWRSCVDIFGTYVAGELSIEDMLAYSLRFLGNPLGPEWDQLHGRFSPPMQRTLGFLLALRLASTGQQEQAAAILTMLPDDADDPTLSQAMAWLGAGLAAEADPLRW